MPDTVTICGSAILAAIFVLATGNPRRFGSSAVNRKVSLILTLTAWLFATGSHWDLLQTFAWGKMFATYAQSMSYTDAAKLTFSADNLCGVCEIVADAEQTDADRESATGNTGARKIQLSLVNVPQITLSAPDAHRWSLSNQDMPIPRGASPPTPPPRA